MMGLMILGFFAIYLIATIFVTRKTVSWAKANGKRPWLWGGLAAFVMYNLVFWDWIPTVVMHKYYCATQAGFTVYKTPGQWMKENPNMNKGVEYQEKISSDRAVEEIEGGVMTTVSVNRRTKIKYIFKVVSIMSILNIRKHEETLIDSSNNLVLLKRVFFSAGHFGGAPKSISDYRFWANCPACDGLNGNISKKKFTDMSATYVNLGESND